MSTILLNGIWNLVGTSPENDIIKLKAAVPGSALNDILCAESDSDYNNVFYRDNAEKYQKYENYNWVYSTFFNVENICLNKKIVFEKLDTYCDIYINEKHIAYCDNGFIKHEFDITDVLKEGENKIEIYMYSPIQAVRGKKSRQSAFSTGRLYTRRMQCTYGWDWTMRFVTCGIGNVYIVTQNNNMRVNDVYVYTKNIDNDCAELGVNIDFDNYKKGSIVNIKVKNPKGEIVYTYSQYCEECFMKHSLDIENAELWYPNGYGKSPLYKLLVDCGGENTKEINFGIRTVKIMQIPDKPESENYNKCIELKKSEFSKLRDKNKEFSGFVVKINGKKIMCKGANWVPCEPFDGKDTSKKITYLVEMAKQCGINILRVWGGGAFESEHFYNECSRLGITVVQDFLMACGSYPDDERWFVDQIKKEAEYAVKLIRNQPCLLWWCGDNENATMVTYTDKDYDGRNAAFKASAPAIYKYDPYREFFQTSPFGGKYYSSNTVGLTHNTYFMSDLFKYAENENMHDFKQKYKQFNARFIAEEPVFGACSYLSLKKFMNDGDIFNDDLNMWKYHTKNNPSLCKTLLEYVIDMAKKLFGDFKNGKDRLFKLQFVQYEWLTISMEQARREKGFCGGVVFWMFNDCWPAAAGWSLIDYYGMPKASYYAFKRISKYVIGSIDLIDNEYKIMVLSDVPSQNINVKCIKYSIKDNTAETVFEGSVSTDENRAETAYTLHKDSVGDREILVLDICNEKGNRDRSFDKQNGHALVPCNVTVKDNKDGCLTVTAAKYVHCVELEADAVFEDNYFSLMPGEIKSIFYNNAKNETVDINVKGYTFE